MNDVFHRSAKEYRGFGKWDKARRDAYPEATHLSTSTYITVLVSKKGRESTDHRVIELGFCHDRDKTMCGNPLGRLVINKQID
jgi:hypothetical protein